MTTSKQIQEPFYVVVNNILRDSYIHKTLRGRYKVQELFPNNPDEVEIIISKSYKESNFDGVLNGISGTMITDLLTLFNVTYMTIDKDGNIRLYIVKDLQGWGNERDE